MPNHTELLELLLKNRGIEDREAFLNPSYEKGLYDPFLMKDMERAVVRIFEAIEGKEKILIYGDYDCDGIPACVMMHDFFKKINYENFSVYIPDRQDEGYGLHSDAIDLFIKDEFKLIVTFDLGITAISQVAKAEASGIDVIITDHHLPQDEIPKAYAVVDPKQEDCKYPDKMLAGAGVAFKLVEGLVKKYGEYWKIHKGWEKWLLDMAAVATISDLVPLVNENRVLAYYGLKVLQKGKRPGLYELFRKNQVNVSRITEEDINFTLAPRINAASRIGDPLRAYELLKTTDQVEAKTLSDYLSKINSDRKVMVAHIMKDVKNLLKKREEKSLIVIGNPTWRIGILGIVASKITEEYKKPAFVWGSDGNGEIKGSCRGVGAVNLVEMMSQLPIDTLTQFGGHKGAGGFSVSKDQIHFLEERLLEVFDSAPEVKEDDCMIDATISIDDVNRDNYAVIEKLAPFGVGNPKPTFLLKNLLIDKVNEFGKEKNHLELSFKNSNGRIIKAISFFKTRNSFENIEVGSLINMIATFEKSTFLGRDELRLRIVDII